MYIYQTGLFIFLIKGIVVQQNAYLIVDPIIRHISKTPMFLENESPWPLYFNQYSVSLKFTTGNSNQYWEWASGFLGNQFWRCWLSIS